MDWTKPIAGNMLVALIFIRWFYRRLGSKMGSVIYDRCDVRLANGILSTAKDENAERARKRRHRGRMKGLLFSVTDMHREHARTLTDSHIAKSQTWLVEFANHT